MWPDALRVQAPHFSAAEPMAIWQRRLLAVLVTSILIGMVVSPDLSATLLMAVLTPIFLCVAFLRATALWVFTRMPPVAHAPAVPAAEPLPIYSILVPLYAEAHMAGSLVAALERIDWPPDRRDFIFITETGDDATRLALEAVIGDRVGMRIIVVPPGNPRTKPRALMYALPHAIGELVVVFDAEDEPEPGQLREAFRRFYFSGPELGCLQARLNIYNVRASLITRQFTLEYTALFDALLPAVEHLRLPLPLGGTSNHFRRHVLDECGGWDPYNVTEDADLGFRLARLGYCVAMLNSTTWEEAPPTIRGWTGQRSRWLKGWMQTTLVHLRDPARLRSELGTRGFLGFNILMGGVIFSALVHPLVYAYALWKLATGDLTLWPPDGWLAVFWWAGAANLMVAYVVGIALAMICGWRRHGPRLAFHALLLPIYWLMISFAAYRAVFDLARQPFHWRKTAHQGKAGAYRRNSSE